ncbi:glutathione S-transferase family protein [Roseomonas sp. KE0001]|uniref:glutathione S-transferase family protein n=1 Tax=Roseomonas sp. KE0001 TaxID=2479201 RepID=UPI001E5DA42A|nr:glutathione S-transferase N-terminal domain-containing protein [Roseomonas sp. KE0001]
MFVAAILWGNDTMKLYYSPGACSLGIHVILEEIGQPYEAVLVALKDGAQHKPEFQAVNPKAKVPALQRPDGSVLTEWPAIAFYLAASNPQAGLWPEGVEAQARCLEAMDYICGTIHPQGFTRQFRAANFTPTEADQPKVIEQGKALASKGFETLDKLWAGQDWLLPGGYSVADAALFFVSFWAIRRVGMPVPPRITAHFERMLARPAVQRTLATEGLSA